MASKTVSLPIWKSTTKSCAAADSEIGSVNCLASKTVSLSIWKSVAKSYATTDLEISRDDGVISGFTLTFFLGVYTFPHGIIIYFTN